LRAPFFSASGALPARPLVYVSLTGDDGRTGYGEAAPLPSYDGVDVSDVLAALEAWEPSAGGPLPALRQAAAAVDLARWDLAGRRAGAPVWRLLGAASPAPVAVNATVAVEEPDGAAEVAASAARTGFRCVKVKVGAGDDLARVHAVRAAVGGDVAIRLDANGAWTVEQAIAALAAMEPLRIECCEEPVHGADALARVAAATPVPVAADESANDPGLLERRACAAVCLKVAACGGITGVIETARRARAAGYQVYLASTLDGPLGIAAALHAAAVIRPDRPCGLATLSAFEAPDPLPPEAGFMRAPSDPGLGPRPPL
jgi:o-succinylbenzoate synthase